MIMLDYGDSLPIDAYTWTMQLAHTNSSLNPFLYYYFNPPIRQGFIKIFSKNEAKPKKETIINETVSRKETHDDTFTNMNVSEL